MLSCMLPQAHNVLSWLRYFLLYHSQAITVNVVRDMRHPSMQWRVHGRSSCMCPASTATQTPRSQTTWPPSTVTLILTSLARWDDRDNKERELYKHAACLAKKCVTWLFVCLLLLMKFIVLGNSSTANAKCWWWDTSLWLECLQQVHQFMLLVHFKEYWGRAWAVYIVTIATYAAVPVVSQHYSHCLYCSTSTNNTQAL